ncbi:hypothetical protein AB0L22_08800 [Micromonospora haikouensis]|uniref:hypothetical protein n=1 Tax=Micromonospora haikouensis TaxID=686309 RepID=UPI00343EFBCB
MTTTDPTTTPSAGSDINLHTWCADTAASHRYYEEEELAPYPGDDRDRGLAEWVVMALGNPEQAGSRQVLAVLAARHGLALTPADTAGEVDRLREQVFAQQPVIDAAQAWAEAHEDSDVRLIRRPSAHPAVTGLYDAVEQYRLMDLALATARAEQPTTEPANTEQQYLIWSHHHGMWWGPAGSGYRSHHADAGRYTLADTKQWLGRSCDCCEVPEVVVPVPAPSESGSTSVQRLIAEATKARIAAGDVNRAAMAAR